MWILIAKKRNDLSILLYWSLDNENEQHDIIFGMFFLSNFVFVVSSNAMHISNLSHEKHAATATQKAHKIFSIIAVDRAIY